MSDRPNIDLEVYVEGIEITDDGKKVYIKIRPAWDEHAKVMSIIEPYAANQITRLRLTSNLKAGRAD